MKASRPRSPALIFFLVASLMRVFSFRLAVTSLQGVRSLTRPSKKPPSFPPFELPFLLSGSRGQFEGDNASNLRRIEEEICMFNNGSPFNANSPKQVALAVFGVPHSTNREVLQQAAKGQLLLESGEPLSDAQQRLAALVLEYREQHRCRQTGNVIEQNGKTSTTDEGIGIEAETNSQPAMQISIEKNVKTSIASCLCAGIEAETDSQPTEKVDRPNKLPKQSINDSSQYEQLVDSLFDNKHCQIDDYWRDQLKQVRPAARALVAQLDSTICPMGYNPLAVPHDPLRGSSSSLPPTTAGNKGSFLQYCRDKKGKHPECILLTRCGDFFEAFGVDALLLVEHCGLRPMAGKARAGFPFRGIQPSLDCLVQKGFKVAVYEEATDTDASAGKAKSSRLKTRMLAQIVTPASPTYMYDLVLLGNTADTLAALPARPYMGVLSLASGYTLVEVSIEERSVRVSERLTAEAVAASLAASPPASPLLVVPSPNQYLTSEHSKIAPYLPAASKTNHGAKLSIKVIPPSLVPETKDGASDIEMARNVIVSSLLEMAELGEGEVDDESSTASRKAATLDDFQFVASPSKHEVDKMSPTAKTSTYPLHVETAKQLGLLLDDHSIPPLMSYVLPESAQASTRRFLRRYLLTPPPPVVCEAMARLISCLKNEALSIPPGTVPPLGKVLSLLRAGQASAVVYGEILHALASTIMILDIEAHQVSDDGTTWDTRSNLIDPLMTILEHESGMSAEPDSLKRRCMDAMEAIENVVSPLHHPPMTTRSGEHISEDCISDFGDVLIPPGFLERNEANWRGRVQPHVAFDAYDDVNKAANALAHAVAIDFFGLSTDAVTDLTREESKPIKNPIVQDIHNNMFALKEIPQWVESADKDNYIHPLDRNGKILRKHYTTEAVRSALSAYVSACEDACQSISNVLTKLSRDLDDNGHIPSIVQAAHSNLIMYSAHEHARQANALGWNSAEVYDCDESNEYSKSAGFFEGVWPYWMHRSTAAQNSYEMKDLFLLTAPNMSGKSTLMRASAAAALLSVCGLCAPLNPGSRLRRFDHLFVRGASADVPAEHKSAFGAEMLDIAALLRCCGPKSLVFVDELGRGTSPKDGTRLAGAVLEAMAKSHMSGFFATHLHDILQLPLECSERIVKKRMEIEEVAADGASQGAGMNYKWTYRLTDGVCTNSMALVTAAQFGLPPDVLARAEALSPFVPGGIPSTRQDSPNGTSLADPVDKQGSNEAVRVNGTTGNRFDLKSAAELVVSVSGQAPSRVPSSWSPPASLEGQSCVYVLQLINGDGEPRFYTGETDSLQKRLRQHRAKGASWSNAECIAVPIHGGKSEARSIESILIQTMAKAGYPMKSTFDGRTLRPSQQH